MRWYDYIPLNLFWLGLSIRNRAVASVFTPYLLAAFVPEAYRNTAAGAIGAAGLVVAMVTQPAAGLLSDRSTSRFGRRRPYLFVGVLLDLVFLAAIALARNLWSLLAATLLIQFSANISHGPLQGLIPDLVPEEQRGRASAVKTLMELLSLLAVGSVIAKLVGAGCLEGAAVAVGAILLASMLLTVLLVKESPCRAKPATPLAPAMRRLWRAPAGIGAGALVGCLAGGLIGGVVGLIAWRLTDASTAWIVGVGVGGLVAMAVAVVAGIWAGALAVLGSEARRRASFTWWMVNRLMFLTALSIGDLILFFLMFAFGMDRGAAAGMSGDLIIMVGVSTLAAGIGGGWLADRFGRKPVAGLGGLLAAAGVATLLGAIWTPNPILVYLAGVVLGAGAGLFMTANWALGTDLVPPEEAGRYLGVSNLASAGAGIIGKSVGGLLADRLNSLRPGLGYAVLFAGYAVLFLLSVAALAGVADRKNGDKPVLS